MGSARRSWTRDGPVNSSHGRHISFACPNSRPSMLEFMAQVDNERGIRFEVAQTMGWERGYYYRVRKVNGRVVREYVGTGRVAELVAQMDALDREDRRLEALERRQEKADLAALDADIKALMETTDLVARAALLA